MHVTGFHLQQFRRFTDLTVSGIDPAARLVVMAGPNGIGKSSVFDGFRQFQMNSVGMGGMDASYHTKADQAGIQTGGASCNVTLDEPFVDQDSINRSFYIRTAYRNEADFNSTMFQKPPRVLDLPRANKMMEPESVVSQNYAQLIGQTLTGVFDTANDAMLVKELRERLIGEVREAMGNVFADLKLQGINDPLTDGTFFFEKGLSKGWTYKNLSGGEKAAFDLILDVIIKRSTYVNTVYCIDEPETHLNTRVQAKLLSELLRLVPQSCQLWIASHSIGMMREAWRLHQEGEPVAFIDFEGHNFDEPVSLQPIKPSRGFWQRILSTAIGDLVDLVAPQEVVLVEGQPKTGSAVKGNIAFDAKCLEAIFRDARPQAGFISVGSSKDVQSDRLALGEGVQTFVPGASIIRLIDRDDMSDQEVALVKATLGNRVLDERDLENYLLSDELLTKLCLEREQAEKAQTCIDKKAELLAQGVAAGKPSDDVKQAAGLLYNFLKQELNLVRVGDNVNSFLRDTMAPLMSPDTNTYQSLEACIFTSA